MGSGLSGPRTLIYDIELAPNIVSAWNLFNTTISMSQIIEPSRIICFAWRWQGERGKTQFSSEWDDGYPEMIATLHSLFDQADVVCGYNSVGFDDKHSRAAFLTEGLAPPSPFKQLDLYKEIKRQFQFPSKKLDYVCGRLGLGHKVSHSGQQLWDSVLRPETEEEGVKARKLMARYCKTDVDLTSDLYALLFPWLKVPINAGLFVDDDDPVCRACGNENIQRRGWAYTTDLRYRRYYCPACHRWAKGKSADKTSELRSA